MIRVNDFARPSTQEIIKDLWSDFGDTPVNSEDCIDNKFLHFDVGTPKEEVWGWFDELAENGVAGLMYNIVLPVGK